MLICHNGDRSFRVVEIDVFGPDEDGDWFVRLGGKRDMHIIAELSDQEAENLKLLLNRAANSDNIAVWPFSIDAAAVIEEKFAGLSRNTNRAERESPDDADPNAGDAVIVSSKVEIKISRDFTKLPGGRYSANSLSSAEEFRRIHLEPHFKPGMTHAITVDLDGTCGYTDEFLEEAFGGLARIHGAVLRRVSFVSNEEPELPDRIKRFIGEAATD